MKLKKDFIVHDTGKEVMLVATGKAKFSGLVKGNAMLGNILDQLKSNTTEKQIVAKLRVQYDAPEGKIERDVRKVLTELKKIGALDV
ncbi:MAG: PqqD family protein [Ruminococcus sp.]|nr:PqqD family protein [Ruminococcus sp.]